MFLEHGPSSSWGFKKPYPTASLLSTLEQEELCIPVQFSLSLSLSLSVYQLLSHVRLFATPWTLAHQALLSMDFFRQEQWTGLPFPSPADLSNPGIEPASSVLQADSLPSEPPGKPVYFSTWYEIKDKPQKFHVSRENSPWDKNTQLRDRQTQNESVIYLFFKGTGGGTFSKLG